jgi:integrase
MKKKQINSDAIDVIMPHLVQNSNAWFIEYSCYYSKTNKLEKFREYKGFKKLESDKEKLKLAKRKIESLSKKLKGGWRPWDSTVYLYKDEIQYRSETNSFGNNKYNNSHIRKYLSGFLADTKRRVSAKTYESYQSKTRLFCQWLENNEYGKLRIFEIDNKIVKQFFNYLIEVRKLDKPTIQKYNQNIHQMFASFVKKKLIENIPMSDIPVPPKTKDMAARPIKDNDMRSLLNYVAQKDPQLFLACLMQFFLCCRPGKELRLLKVQDIDLHGNIVHITEADGKKGKRKITMPEALVELCQTLKLQNYEQDFYVFSKNGKPGKVALGKNYFSRKFVQYRKELKLPSIYKFYSFKHTGAGKLLESGATVAELMSHLGHTSFESTIAYVRRHFGEKSEKILNFRPDVLNGLLK